MPYVQHQTAHCLLDELHAYYVVTAVKANQFTMLKDLEALDYHRAPSHEAFDWVHGREERRRCWSIDLTNPKQDSHANLHRCKQALRIERSRHLIKRGKTSTEAHRHDATRVQEVMGLTLKPLPH